LYRGLPANKTGARNSSLFGDEGRRKKKTSLFDDDDSLDFGGYDPTSFGSQGKQTRQRLEAEDTNTWKVKDSSVGGAKKTGTLNNIFGDSQTRKQPSLFDDGDDIFATSQKPKPAAQRDRSEFPWESNSKPVSKDKVLPLRPRANNTTIHNKPTVRAIDDFDDDLEEVML